MTMHFTDDAVKAIQTAQLSLNTTPKNAQDVQTIVESLNAGWRNQVAKQLGMKTDTFQLAQGSLGLQSSDSSGLFRMADAVPAGGVVGYYDPSSATQFSTNYNMMLHALLPSNSGGLVAALGPMYAKWIAYRSADTSGDPQLTVFTKWANSNLDPSKMTAALTAYKAAMSDPLNTALDAYINTANYTGFVDDTNSPYTLPTYSCTISTAKSQVKNAGPVTISFDSTTMDTSSVGTTVKGTASGLFEIFSGGVGGSYTALDQMAASSGFTISGTIANYGTISVDRGAWYDSSQLTRAFGAPNDNNVWDPAANQGNWNSFFGTDGSLARRVSELLLVSGYDLTVTSKASYTASQFQQIKTDAKVGIWPFFSASVETTHTTDYQQGANGELIVNYKQNPGEIAIWGATIADAPN